MTGFTESWGASWGDLNGDNWPDLFIQGHRDFPRFYRNTGDGSFEDVAYELDPGNWIAKPMDDKHGASWADFDNDGDEDLLIGVSATGPAQLLVNDDGTFTERAQDADISSDSTNRHSVWFDYNRDGFLDVAQLYLGGATLRRQDPSDGLDFDNYHTSARFSCPGRLDYGQMIDVNNDGVLEFICAETDTFPLRVFNIATFPFRDVTGSVPSATLVNDTAVADFNRDLRSDIVMTRGAVRPSGAKLVSDTHIEAWLRSSDSSSLIKGFSFVAPGQITVALDHSGMGVRENSRVFVLNTQGPTSVTDGPVTVRYNSGSGRWEASIGNSNSPQAYIVVDTVATVSDFIVTGLDNSESTVETLYLENSASGMSYDYGTGLFEPVSCVSAAAGDFDNDMDVDLYLVCRTGVENLANRLYENQGDGSFLLVSQSGAEGPVGVGEAFGVGDSVVVA
ncbi:MAG: VCBS repeat-containing protein, partial [Gammaproteobacteria bacterium]|nr:VCBS repeat-containing protein [Gammaproteobacteria bacterium]